jgi:hypothetical protein
MQAAVIVQDKWDHMYSPHYLRTGDPCNNLQLSNSFKYPHYVIQAEEYCRLGRDA